MKNLLPAIRFLFLTGFGLLFAGATPATDSLSAQIRLESSAVSATQTGDTAWTLEKTGSAYPTYVTWSITATEVDTVAGRLVVNGQMTVENTGSGPATIGNIVVNLQKRVGNKWATVSSDIANATDGDDATSADIHKAASSEGNGSFSENGASGELDFMDATNNTMFSLVPQVMIDGGASRTLLFQASFDYNVLDLAAGTPIRSEVIVSFGNASNGNSTANVDINGNGSIDADEARVRSVPARLGVQVPAAVNGNSTVSLTDTLADIATTGTVSFSNAHFNLGATSGTVSVTVDGGTDGGTITNCAHLTGDSSTVNAGGFVFPVINGVDLEDCSTITIGATTCTPGTAGCGWEAGDMTTFEQLAWGTPGSAAAGVLATNFASVFGANVTIGGNFIMRFTSATDIFNYLPAAGTPGALTFDLLNPTSSSSGSLGGQVLALKLNVDLSDAGALGSTTPLGDLRFCNFSSVPSLNNQTVRQFLASANATLGGGAAPIAASTASGVASLVNSAFAAGAPSAFAQSVLVAGSCP